MSIYIAILCGLAQGAAEFLPVSSSAHLALLERTFSSAGFAPDVTFDLLLHLGTLIAVFFVYFKDIAKLFPAAFSVVSKAARLRFSLSKAEKEEKLVCFLFLSTLPLCLAFFIKDKVLFVREYPFAIGALLILNGVMLLISDFLKRNADKKRDMTPFGALTVGAFQLFALFPGISRSGATVTGSLLCGLDRKEAVKYSFLLSFPAIIGANLFSLGEADLSSLEGDAAACYLLGAITAAVSGFFAIKLLIKISGSSRFAPFAYYCIALGTAAVLFNR